MNNITIMTTNTGCDIDVDVYGYRLQPKYMNKSTSELSYLLHHMSSGCYRVRKQ